MNGSEVVSALNKVLSFVEDFGPLASAFGIPAVGQVAAIAASASSIAQNILERIQEGQVAMNSSDQNEIRAIAERLAAVNDELAAKIASS